MKIAKRNRLGLIAVFVIVAITVVGLSSAQGKDYSANLELLEYFSVGPSRTMDETGTIEWAFTGSNTAVGITVIIMDEENYLLFVADDPAALGYIVSDGSYYSHSGTFTIPELDKWYVVFMHLDVLVPLQTSTVNMTVNFIGGGLAIWLLIIIIVAPIVVVGGIITLIVVLLIRKKKQPALPAQDYAAQPAEPTPQTDTVFCSKCGQANATGSTFCSKCGNALT